MQILLKVFSRSQEGRGTASDTGLKGTESAFQVLQVQDADKCHSALHVVRPGDWFTLIDLKDPYFHISIYPLHIKFLQLVIQGKMHEYLVLPFVSLSPWVFVKCT